MYRISMHVDETQDRVIAAFHVNAYNDDGKRSQIAYSAHSLPLFAEENGDLAAVCRRFVQFAQIFCGEHADRDTPNHLF